MTKFDVDSVNVNDTVVVSPTPRDPEPDRVIDVTAGDVVSITIALLPAMLLPPDGTEVEAIEFPAVSLTVPTVNELTVRSSEVSPA